MVKNKSILFYILISVGVIFVTAAFILVYNLCIDKGFLYFEKAIIDVDFGDNYDIEDLGLKTNIDGVVIECDRATIDGDNITFDKAGLCIIKVKGGRYEAKLQVRVAFNNIDEYMSIFATVGNERFALNESSKLDLFLPSCDRVLAASDGYYSECIFDVEYVSVEDSFSIVAGSGFVVDGNKIVTNRLGKFYVYFEFEEFGKSFDIEINVSPVLVEDIVCGYSHNTLYVQKGIVFDLEVEVLPVYATNKVYETEIEGDCVRYLQGKLFANNFGECFIICKSGSVICEIKVIVCEVPDSIVCSIVSPFEYGKIGSASVSIYKGGRLIDGEFYIECYMSGQLIDSDLVIKDFEIKHNAFVAEIISEDNFVIVVKCKQNNDISFEISVNNQPNVV